MTFMVPLFHMHHRSRGYAVDGCLLFTGPSTEENAQAAAVELEQINSWCKDNGLGLDSDKTALLHLTKRIKAKNSNITLRYGTCIKVTPLKGTLKWLWGGGVNSNSNSSANLHLRSMP